MKKIKSFMKKDNPDRIAPLSATIFFFKKEKDCSGKRELS